MRGFALPGGRKAILSDTVGFISDLPTGLVAAFRATLEEVIGADLILHVRDISHPETADQAESVHAVLRDLGLGEVVERGLFEVWNKIDLLDAAGRAEKLGLAMQSNLPRVAVSALTGEGCDRLLDEIERNLSGGHRVIEAHVPLSDGASLAWIYRRGEVLRRHDDEQFAHLVVRLEDADLARANARTGIRISSPR
jgi:GTP-binding protein HflX